MPERFAEVTQRIINKLPYWWKIKKNPSEAIGAHFLNVIGIELEEAIYILSYALKQIHLVTADVTQADICYKGRLPVSVTEDMLITLSTKEGHQLQPASSLDEFFSGFSTELAYTPALLLEHVYYIDWETRTVYSRYTYDQEDGYPEGQLQLVIYNDNGTVLANRPLKLSLHHVWNFFDEFGLLLCCPRLYGERNAAYKERILDVMRFPGSANATGMINGMARELLLKYKETWYDGAKDLVLARPYIAKHTIMIDDRSAEEFEYSEDESKRIVLHGDPAFEGHKRIVTYAAGIDLRQFWYKGDKEFMSELYIPDGDATLRLRQYVKLIKDRVPIEWGQFRWSQGVWDSFHPNKSGTACIPSFCDGSVRGWVNYGGEA